MNYIKIRVGRDLSGIDAEFRRVIGDMFRMMNPRFSFSQHTWVPHMDIFQTDSEIVITCELAGMKAEDIHVETDMKSLKIFGLRRERPSSHAGNYLLAEIPSGYFERIIPLSHPLDTDAVEATYAEGLLQIRLKKLSCDNIRNVTVRCIS